MDDCAACGIVKRLGQGGALESLGEYWTVNSRIGHDRPGLVVQSRAHRAELADLDVAEHATLGPALAAAATALGEQPRVERAYVALWNEGTPHHVHFHVIARMDDDSERGPALPDARTPHMDAVDTVRASRRAAELVQCQFTAPQAPDNTREVPSQRRARKLRILAAIAEEPSPVVRVIRRCALAWSHYASAYNIAMCAIDRWKQPKHRITAADIYVPFWVIVALTLFVVAASAGPVAHPAQAALSTVILYRVLDIGLTEAGILLQTEMSRLQSIGRAVVFRGLNLLELGIGVAAVSGFVREQSLGSMIEAGFGAVTLSPVFGNPGRLADAITLLASATALVVLSGGLAMLLGKVGESFYVNRDSN